MNSLRKRLCALTYASVMTITMGLETNALPLTKPILVELFTSEGCSSCPAADSYLSELRKYNKNIILLGEHVDYWNNLGWKDPFSSSVWTDRQKSYCQKLGASSCYTPQVVINGQRECVGSNQAAIQKAIDETANALTATLELRIAKQSESAVDVSLMLGHTTGTPQVEIFLVEDDVTVNVARGENGGRKLSHDGVVRAHSIIKAVKSGVLASASLPLDPASRHHNYRVVAIVEGYNGPIGAAQQALSNQ